MAARTHLKSAFVARLSEKTDDEAASQKARRRSATGTVMHPEGPCATLRTFWRDNEVSGFCSQPQQKGFLR